MEGLSHGEMTSRWDEIINSGGKCSPEEYSLTRKMIAASFKHNLGVGEIRHPLFLIDLHNVQPSKPEALIGSQLEYVDGAKRYAEGQTSLSGIVEQQQILARKVQEQKKAQEKEKALDAEILALHLETAKLQRKHHQRRTIIKHLRALEDMPAVQPDFLDPGIIYKNCSPMPEMPKEMIDGFAVDHTGTNAKAEELLQNLKNHVLRSKLMAQRQQTTYERSRAEKPIDINDLSPDVKLYALDAVKNALISWIEAQLAKAGDDSSEPGADGETANTNIDYDHDSVMGEIQQKYQHHIELRQSVLDQYAQLEHVKEKLEAAAVVVEGPKTQHQTSLEGPPQPAYVPEAYLFTPYIQQLQTLASRQKYMVQEKSHINSSLVKQRREIRYVLDNIAEQSQLLSSFPATKETTTSEPSLDDLAGETKLADAIKPWLYAADSAKLATLVEVAESVEVGMESIDEGRLQLEQICKLLNIAFPQAGEEAEAQDGLEDATNISRSPKKEQTQKDDELKSIWDILDGNLGSINE